MIKFCKTTFEIKLVHSNWNLEKKILCRVPFLWHTAKMLLPAKINTSSTYIYIIASAVCLLTLLLSEQKRQPVSWRPLPHSLLVLFIFTPCIRVSRSGTPASWRPIPHSLHLIALGFPFLEMARLSKKATGSPLMTYVCTCNTPNKCSIFVVNIDDCSWNNTS